MLEAVSPNSRDKSIGTTYSKNSSQMHNSFALVIYSVRLIDKQNIPPITYS